MVNLDYQDHHQNQSDIPNDANIFHIKPAQQPLSGTDDIVLLKLGVNRKKKCAVIYL